MGTFVTKSDLGIGTIVGSAVFNIFGVISVCGLFSGQKIPLDWYPITRDCLLYGLTVITLFIVLVDEQVFWWESLTMFIFYLFYILIMALNPHIDRWAHSAMKSIKKRVYPSLTNAGSEANNPNESTPLHTISKTTPNVEIGSPNIRCASENRGNVDGNFSLVRIERFWQFQCVRTQKICEIL